MSALSWKISSEALSRRRRLPRSVNGTPVCSGKAAVWILPIHGLTCARKVGPGMPELTSGLAFRNWNDDLELLLFLFQGDRKRCRRIKTEVMAIWKESLLFPTLDVLPWLSILFSNVQNIKINEGTCGPGVSNWFDLVVIYDVVRVAEMHDYATRNEKRVKMKKMSK